MSEALSNESQNNGISAFFGTGPHINNFLPKYCDKYMNVGPTQRTVGYAFVFPRGSSLVSDVSRAAICVRLYSDMYGPREYCCIKQHKLGELCRPFWYYWRNKDSQDLELEDISVSSHFGSSPALPRSSHSSDSCTEVEGRDVNDQTIHCSSEDRVIVHHYGMVKLSSLQILIRTNAGNPVTRTGEIILHDTLVDIAALRCDPLLPLLPEARLAKVDDIQSGESLYCLSYKGGVPNSFSKGYVVHPGRRTLCPSSSTQCILYHDVKLNFGSSGGALFTVDKEVVAITLACRVDCPSLELALKASELDRFLTRVQEVESMKFAP
ncbi:hypothetical protein RJ639_002924 [Escallonia herrerae]|uniref:Uncharacterized protein n=1 Tax=Escallonia herrerae TaxID=1293975 RepID=A0AA88VZC9_9ASTE|nr:hypothetical protein RJ639_002924 [Escallonia herrerae]